MDKKLKFGKDDLIDIVKSSLIAVVSSLVLILVFAIIIKFTGIEDKIILINMVIKSLSVVIGILFGIKNARLGAVKGLASGVLFVLVTYILFAIINLDGKIDLMMVIDSLIIMAESLVSGIIAVNIKDRKADRR